MATTEIDGDVDAYHSLNMTLETNVLDVAVKGDKKELQVMKELSLEKAALLPSYTMTTLTSTTHKKYLQLWRWSWTNYDKR